MRGICCGTSTAAEWTERPLLHGHWARPWSRGFAGLLRLRQAVRSGPAHRAAEEAGLQGGLQVALVGPELPPALSPPQLKLLASCLLMLQHRVLTLLLELMHQTRCSSSGGGLQTRWVQRHLAESPLACVLLQTRVLAGQLPLAYRAPRPTTTMTTMPRSFGAEHAIG